MRKKAVIEELEVVKKALENVKFNYRTERLLSENEIYRLYHRATGIRVFCERKKSWFATTFIFHFIKGNTSDFTYTVVEENWNFAGAFREAREVAEEYFKEREECGEVEK